jgi:hypothetical protein
MKGSDMESEIVYSIYPKNKQYPDVYCDNCNEYMPRDDTENLPQALGIVFVGGYGWFIDSLVSELEATICFKCIMVLKDSMPGLFKVLISDGIDMSSGHVHNGEYSSVNYMDCLECSISRHPSNGGK